MAKEKLKREISLCYLCRSRQATHRRGFRQGSALYSIILCGTCASLKDDELNELLNGGGFVRVDFGERYDHNNTEARNDYNCMEARNDTN